jgi:glycosyltransferase involved in cell wall biosynthesis
MRITFPLAGLNLSGGVRVIIHIANGLTKNGHKVRLIVPDYAAQSNFHLDDGVRLQIIPTIGKGIWRKIHYFLKVCRIAVEDSDICFATGYKSPYYIFCSKIIRHSNAKLLYLIQSYEPLSHVTYSNRCPLAKWVLYNLAKISYRLPFNRKIAVSQWIKKQIRDDTILVINNGIDLGVFSPGSDISERGHFVIGTIGSSVPLKGYDTFLQAMKIISGNERLKVLVVSHENLELPKCISSELIRPKGDKQLVEFYRRCNVFVFTSFFEGFGLPPLEAMACGIPVITTNCGGVRDFANDSNAIIVSPGDFRAIANAIMRLKKDENLRRRLRLQGIKTARKFSLEKMISQYCELLNGINKHDHES